MIRSKKIRSDEYSKHGCVAFLLLLCVGFFFPAVHELWAQSEKVADLLATAGFERVRCKMLGDTLFFALENRVYRGSYRGIGASLKLLSDSFPSIRHYQLSVQEDGSPCLRVAATKEKEVWLVDADYNMAAVERILSKGDGKDLAVTAGSNGKIDITFHPIVSIDNHSMDVLAEVGIFLAPAVETTLWQGNRITVQPVIPVYNNYRAGNTDRQLQSGVVAIRQDWRMGNHWRLSTAAGTFLYNLWGLHQEGYFHVNRNLDVGFHVGLSADQFQWNGSWQFRHNWHVGAMGKIDYYDPRSSLQVRLSVGSFAYGDVGGRLDIVRHFGEYAVGGYAIYTDGEKNAGFNFAIPLGPRQQRRSRNAYVRLRCPEYFAWEYSMLNYFRYAEKRMGQHYKEMPDKSFTTHYWQAAFVKQYLQRYLEGKVH